MIYESEEFLSTDGRRFSQMKPKITAFGGEAEQQNLICVHL